MIEDVPAWIASMRERFRADVASGQYDAKGYTKAERLAKDRRRQMGLFEGADEPEETKRIVRR